MDGFEDREETAERDQLAGEAGREPQDSAQHEAPAQHQAPPRMEESAWVSPPPGSQGPTEAPVDPPLATPETPEEPPPAPAPDPARDPSARAGQEPSTPPIGLSPNPVVQSPWATGAGASPGHWRGRPTGSPWGAQPSGDRPSWTWSSEPTLPLGPGGEPTAEGPAVGGGDIGEVPPVPGGWPGYYGGWGGPPAGLPPTRRRRGRIGALVVAAVLLVIGGLGSGLAVALTGSSSNLASSGPKASAVSASKINVSAITAEVDPALVDITSSLGYQDSQAAGTGMIVTSSGDVLTNNHVIQGATSISAKIAGTSKTYSAKVLGTDPTDDVALIQLQNASGLPTVQLGDSSTVSVGDPVVAIGNALDLPGSPTVTEGTVSALNRSITAGDSSSSNTEQLSGLIQTDAPLAPGNSGGPLVNSHGQVIGMNTAAASDSQDQSSSSNVGFAIPINTAETIAQEIQSGSTSNSNIKYGSPAFLGVDVESVNSSSGGGGSFGNGPFGGFFGNGGSGTSPSVTSGAVVESVVPNTPAASIGLQAGDVITSFDGHTINSPNDLTQVIQGLHPGDTVSIGWVDSLGQQHTANVQLGTGGAA